MTNPDVVYCWSTDEEGYHGKHATRLEAAIVGMEESGGDFKVGSTIYTAVAVEVDIKGLVNSSVNIDTIFESIGEASWEELGEWADNWPEAPKKDEPGLEGPIIELITNWLKKYRTPTFYQADDVEEMTVTAEMMKEANIE